MRTLNALCFSAAVALSTVAVPALAVDTKFYPGAACEAANPSDRDKFALNVTGAIFGLDQADTLQLLCPVVRDAGRIGSAEVRVIDQSAAEEVRCVLRTVRGDGTVQQQQTVFSNGFASAPQPLKFGAQSALPSTGGHYALECTMPKLGTTGPSGILAYTVVEND